MRTEQAAATENVSTSAQTISPEFQTMQSSPSAGVSETSQTQTAKNNSKTLWIIGGIVAAIIVIIIAVSGGSSSEKGKYIGIRNVDVWGRSITVETCIELKSNNEATYTATNLNTGEIIENVSGTYKFVGQSKNNKQLIITISSGKTLNCTYFGSSMRIENFADYRYVAGTCRKQ